MSSRSLNKVLIIGNLTRDPELRYTPQGTAVCSFSLATNRSWTTESNEKKEEVEFHRIVAWNKLAELCAQLLFKGRKAYIEGRLSTRTWTAQDGTQRQTTEVVAEEMIILDNKVQEGGEMHQGYGAPAGVNDQSTPPAPILPVMPTAPAMSDTPVAVSEEVTTVPTPIVSASDDLSIDDIPDDLGVTELVNDPAETKVEVNVQPAEETPPAAKKVKTETKTDEVVADKPVEDTKVSSDIPF